MQIEGHNARPITWKMSGQVDDNIEHNIFVKTHFHREALIFCLHNLLFFKTSLVTKIGGGPLFVLGTSPLMTAKNEKTNITMTPYYQTHSEKYYGFGLGLYYNKISKTKFLILVLLNI